MPEVQVGQGQLSSIVLKSVAYLPSLRFKGPEYVSATPKRAVLVGKTQSAMSMPSATQTRRSDVEGSVPRERNGSKISYLPRILHPWHILGDL